MIATHVRLHPVIAAFIAFCLGCAPAQMPDAQIDDQEAARVRTVFAGIDARNRTEKKSAAWLTTAYAALGIRNIHDIPAREFSSYGRYVRNDEVYIIVHPGYFPFFDKWKIPRPPADYTGGYPAQNVMERVTGDLPASDIIFRTARAQEKVLRDFIEFQSREQGLVILVIPRDYRKHVTYGQVEGYDEYARYINEISNAAENIVFLESATDYTGKLLDEDLAALLHFMKATGARTVLLGGSFMGRCLDNFYSSLRTVMFTQDIIYVLELTAFSPADLASDKVNLLTDSGALDEKRLEKYFRTFAFDNVTDEWVRWKKLSLYDVRQNR